MEPVGLVTTFWMAVKVLVTPMEIIAAVHLRKQINPKSLISWYVHQCLEFT